MQNVDLSIYLFYFFNFWAKWKVPVIITISRTKSKYYSHLSIILLFIAGSFRVSLFIDLGCPRDLGKGWRGDLGTFMISRPP